MGLTPYYEDRNVTLYHGDCREILPQFEAESLNLVVTDPPYLVSSTGRWGSEWEPIQGDADPTWVLPVFSELYRVLRADALCLSFYGWPHADVFLSSWRTAGFRPVSVFVLVKQRWGLGYFSRGQHESAYLLAKGRPEKPRSSISDVLPWHQPPLAFHPHQKPVGPLSRLITTYSTNPAIILDPFCGSGSTLIAARQSGRIAIGIEVDERYCEATAIRLSQKHFEFDDEEYTARQGHHES